MTLLKKFIGWAFDRHAHTGPKCHNADYEVCPDLLCRLAVWLEETFNPYAAWHEDDDSKYAMPPYGWWDSDADDIEPIRGRVWDQEDIDDLGGIDEGWLDD